VAVVRWLRAPEGEPGEGYPLMDAFFERLLAAVE
jgi:hypothetical protein